MSHKIKTDISDHGIATITFTNPAKHNAMDDEFIHYLNTILLEYTSRTDIHVCILRGEGKSFCAGADIEWMAKAKDYSAEENVEDAKGLAELLYNLYHLPQLTIACVQGRAVGGGMGIVAACDMVIAEKKAVFAFPEVRLGLIPATIAPYVISALGARFCKRLFQTGETFDGIKASHHGLVDELVDDSSEFDQHLQEIKVLIEHNGPQAMRAAKTFLFELNNKHINSDLINVTASRLAVIRSSEEAKEGLSAFLEKRKPNFER